MAQRSIEQTMLGATIALSATLPATYDTAGYGATSMVYTAIGEVSDFGDHGVTASVSKFTAVNDGVTKKFKGAKDYGQMNLIVGYVPSDAGEALLETAVESQNRYSCKVTYPLGTGETTAEIHYMDVLVTKRLFKDGNVDNVRQLDVTFEVCRKTVIVAAT